MGRRSLFGSHAPSATWTLAIRSRFFEEAALAQWDLWEQQIKEVESRIFIRFEEHEDAQLLATMFGVSRFIALSIACRIGPIDRFPRGRSLANFFGLTPGSRSTGETRRLGSITKEGSRLVRCLLAQVVVNVLRRDGTLRAWYKQVKRRRGSKIARVAVMRRLAVTMWHMLTKREAWRPGMLAKPSRPASGDPRTACEPIDRDAVLAPWHELAAAAEAAGESTGSSSLSGVSEERESCPA